MLSKLLRLQYYLKSVGATEEQVRLDYLIKRATDNTHIIVEKDTLSGIAARYDVLLSDLFEVNNLDENSVLRLGMPIALPPQPTRRNNLDTFPSARLTDWMKREEGVAGTSEPHMSSYDDGTGALTIGWGRNQHHQRHQPV